MAHGHERQQICFESMNGGDWIPHYFARVD